MYLGRLRTLFVALACAGTSLCAMAQEKALMVTTRNAGEVLYALNKKPTVTFTESEVVLSTEDVTVSYSLAEHVKLTIVDMADAIKQVESVAAVISYEDGEVKVSKAVPGTLVALYAADGRQLGSTKVRTDGTASLSLNGRGLHVVRVGKLSMKLTN